MSCKGSVGSVPMKTVVHNCCLEECICAAAQEIRHMHEKSTGRGRHSDKVVQQGSIPWSCTLDTKRWAGG